MSDWLKHLQASLALYPGLPLKDVIEIAKTTYYEKSKTKA